jgi:hypothetical protein
MSVFVRRLMAEKTLLAGKTVAVDLATLETDEAHISPDRWLTGTSPSR